MTELFENDDLRVQLAEKMEIDVGDIEDFWPFEDPSADYDVLMWMRHTVKHKWPTTYSIFLSYVSGAMHSYAVGDYARGAMLAIGIINTAKSE